jgi:hypothetical protein
MGDQSNPRKVIQIGNNLGLTLPNGKVEDWGIEKGDRYVFKKTETGLELEPVEWRRASDE